MIATAISEGFDKQRMFNEDEGVRNCWVDSRSLLTDVGKNMGLTWKITTSENVFILTSHIHVAHYDILK